MAPHLLGDSVLGTVATWTAEAAVAATLLIYAGRRLYRRYKTNGTAAIAPLRSQGTLELREGSIVEYAGQIYAMYAMTQTVGATTWHDYALQLHRLDQDGRRPRWIRAEQTNEDYLLTFWVSVEGTSLQPYVADLIFHNRRYRLQKQGKATYTDPAKAEQHDVEYCIYVAPDGQNLLGFERFGDGQWRVSRGAVIERPALIIHQ